MYEDFYRLREKPFALTPDPSFMYPSRHHRFALTMLEYGIANHAAFSLLTGEVGSGKTMLVRQLIANLPSETRVGLITNTNRRFGNLLQWVSLAYELNYRHQTDTELYEQFADFLIREYAGGRRVLLIVDEAQNLDAGMLEELRVLSNVNADKDLVLQTMLVGQPELRDTLRQHELRQFAQRISVDYHLPALTQEEARNYVRHRLHTAGGDPELIDSAAIDLAHARGRGIPRLINQFCDTALVYGFADRLTRIDAELMRQVLDDRSSGGLLPPLPINETQPNLTA